MRSSVPSPLLTRHTSISRAQARDKKSELVQEVKQLRQTLKRKPRQKRCCRAAPFLPRR